MTLIELILYMALVSMIMTGSVFSAYSLMLSQEKVRVSWQTIYEELITYETPVQ